jgi:hypothetical protein
MTLPSSAPSANEPAAQMPPASVKRRGMTIGHWLLIVILAALCVDIGIRIVAFHRASLAAAQALNSQKAIQQLIDNTRKSDELLNRRTLESTKEWQRTKEMFDEYMKLRENAPVPRDPSKGSIIPLSYSRSKGSSATAKGNRPNYLARKRHRLPASEAQSNRRGREPGRREPRKSARELPSRCTCASAS